MTYAIAAAGTGGHVFPGLAVGEALVADGVARSDVLFVGGDRLEATVYPEAGFGFLGVELLGLRRSFTIDNLRIPLVVKRAVDVMTEEFRNRSVGVVLGLGGYVTVPAGIAARRASAVFCVSEQNAHPGLANRLMSRLAARSFASFPDTPGLVNPEWVGNPIRLGLLDSPAAREARESYGLAGDGPVVGVFGGSLGAQALNDEVERSVGAWNAGGVRVIHLVGTRNREIAERADGIEGWVVVPFEDDMGRFYAACDLVVARAGGAVAELTATGTPAVLVPGVFGSSGHQAANAAALEDAGAAVVIDESSIDQIGAVVLDLAFDRDRLESMERAAQSLAKPLAAANIAGVMQELHV